MSEEARVSEGDKNAAGDPNSPSAVSFESPKKHSVDSSLDSGLLATLLDVEMPVVIEIGRANLTVQQVLALNAGSVVPLDRLIGEPVDILVSDRRFAEGEVVVVGDHLGVRITRMIATPCTGRER